MTLIERRTWIKLAHDRGCKWTVMEKYEGTFLFGCIPLHTRLVSENLIGYCGPSRKEDRR